jgi:hypothetical protein
VGAKPKPGAQPDLGFNYDGAAQPRLTSGGIAEISGGIAETSGGIAGLSVYKNYFG